MESQMQRARELIKAGKVDEARALLNRIDHPKAKEWLVKLDELTKKNAAKSTATTAAVIKSTSTNTAVKSTTTTPAVKSTATSAAVKTASAKSTSTNAAVNAAPDDVAPIPPALKAQLDRAALLIKEKHYVAAQQLLKKIKHPVAAKMLASLNEIPSLKRRESARRTNLIIFMVVMLIVGVVAIIGVSVLTRPQTYEDEVLRFQFQFPWAYSAENCIGQVTGCHVRLESGRDLQNSDVNIGWWVERTDTLDNLAQTEYTRVMATGSTGQTIDRIKIQGHPAYQISYTEQLATRAWMYTTSIYMKVGIYMINVNVVSPDGPSRDAMLVETKALMETMVFKPLSS